MERVEYMMEKDLIQSVVVVKVKKIYNLQDVIDFLDEKGVIESGAKPHGFPFINVSMPGFTFYRISLASSQQAAAAYK